MDEIEWSKLTLSFWNNSDADFENGCDTNTTS